MSAPLTPTVRHFTKVIEGAKCERLLLSDGTLLARTNSGRHKCGWTFWGKAKDGLNTLLSNGWQEVVA